MTLKFIWTVCLRCASEMLSKWVGTYFTSYWNILKIHKKREPRWWYIPETLTPWRLREVDLLRLAWATWWGNLKKWRECEREGKRWQEGDIAGEEGRKGREKERDCGRETTEPWEWIENPDFDPSIYKINGYKHLHSVLKKKNGSFWWTMPENCILFLTHLVLNFVVNFYNCTQNKFH